MNTPSTEALSNRPTAADPDELPLLRGSAARVVELASDPRTPLKTLTHAVMVDPALALRLLHRANAIPHRHFRTEVSTLEDAVRMLGTQALSRMAREAPVADQVLDAVTLARYRRCAGQAVLAAMLAADWAESRHDLSPPEVALAALMHNLGELFLLAHGDRRIGRYLDLVEGSHVLPHEAEYVALGQSLERLGLELAERWRLPEMVRESMRARNAQHMRTLGVMLAAQLSRDVLSGWRHPLFGADLRLVSDFLSETPKDVAQRVNRVLTAFEDDASLYDLSSLEPLLPDAWDGSRAMTHKAHFCLAPRADDFAACLAELRSGQGDRERLLKVLVRGLHHGLGLNRVAFAALSPARDHLAAQYLQGTDFEPAFNRFRLPVDKGSLFTRLLDRPAAFWLNAQNRAKAWHQVPESVRELVGVQGFFAMSMFVNGTPIGLVYADRRSADCGLDARAYEAFRLLVRLAGQQLGRLGNGQPYG